MTAIHSDSRTESLVGDLIHYLSDTLRTFGSIELG